MAKYFKALVLCMILIFSVMVTLEKRYDYISYDKYVEGLNRIDPDYIDSGLITPRIDRYLDRHFTVDGEYFRISYNWKEGSIYILGTILLTGIVYQKERKEGLHK